MDISLSTERIEAFLANLDPGDFGAEHCSGGDSWLPKRLRGETPPVRRLPTAAEVEDQMTRDCGLVGAVCTLAGDSATDRDSLREWVGDDFDDMPVRATDDLSYHLSDDAVERAAEAAGILAVWPMTCCGLRPIMLARERDILLVQCPRCATSEWRREDEEGFEEVAAPSP